MVLVKDITEEERKKAIRKRGLYSLIREHFPLMKGFLVSRGLEGYWGVCPILGPKNILEVYFDSPESPRIVLRDSDFYDRAHSLARKIEEKWDGAKVSLDLDYNP
jgi:hypothetical protein